MMNITGHVETLDDKQSESLFYFKRMLMKYKLGSLYDDGYLLRFLRIKKFNAHEAFSMFEDYLKWRTIE